MPNKFLFGSFHFSFLYDKVIAIRCTTLCKEKTKKSNRQNLCKCHTKHPSAASRLNLSLRNMLLPPLPPPPPKKKTTTTTTSTAAVNSLVSGHPLELKKSVRKQSCPLTRIIPIGGHQRKISWMSANGRVN